MGLIAVARRLLVLTAELTGQQPLAETPFGVAMIGLSVLTLMIVALIVSLLMLRGRNRDAVAKRA